MITITVHPPMLARLRSTTVAAFEPAIRAAVALHLQLWWLEWLAANDPDEPKLGRRWIA